MKPFSMLLRDTQHWQRLEGVRIFVGEDASGSFGLLADHAPIMTHLVFGLARFQCGAEPWQYLAMPGAILYFKNNQLRLSTRRFFLSEDYEQMSQVLRDTLTEEEQLLAEMKHKLHRLEEDVLRRIWELGREGPLAHE